MTAELHRTVRVADVMGMAISVHVLTHAPTVTGVDDAIAVAFAELRDIDRVFSTYRSDSDVSRLRRGELTLADADARVGEVARACDEAEAFTRGLFSAHFDGAFDPTGYVKGWAVESVAHWHLAPLLENADVAAWAINAGGDMQVATAAGLDRDWRVGIADPARPGQLAAVVELRDGAVATSGTAERGAHILDPRTGAPALGATSSTVVADSLAVADVWATVGVVAGIDDLGWIRECPGRSGMVIGAGGRTRRWVSGVEVAAAAGDPFRVSA